MQKLAAGNWKMNGSVAALAEVIALIEAHPEPDCQMLLCPPATLLAPMAKTARRTRLLVGGQDCHAKDSGAHTGDISARMLKEVGASHVILGHSERRANHGETDADIRAKVAAAWEAGLIAIVCLGETATERKAGETLAIIASQLEGSIPKGATPENLVIAYEPVWAIGTGKTPTVEEIEEAHAFLRDRLRKTMGTAAAGVRILYGGSVKPSNAEEIFAIPNVDGALVGGASLKAAEFGAIVDALSAA